MDFTPYLVILSSRTHPRDLYHSMEPPKSPKFNITLWQPWLAEKQEVLNGGSPCGSSGVGSPDGATEPPAAAAPGARHLPSTKWRRDRRSTTRVPDYKHREAGLTGNKALRSQSFNDKGSPRVLEAVLPRNHRDGGLRHSAGDLANCEGEMQTESTVNLKAVVSAPKPPDYTETPLDMSVKIRSSPPSYSQSISNGLLYRPSVITQAPVNGVPPVPVSPPVSKIDGGKGEYVPGSMSMCDPVIDEHFRRSLGADYMTLFSKSKDVVSNGKSQKPVTKDRGSSPIMFASDPCSKFLNTTQSPKESPDTSTDLKVDATESAESEDCEMEVDDCAGLSVDDHFAKALGDTWKKLQEKNPKIDILKINSSPDNVTKNNALSSSNNRNDLPTSNHDKKIARGIVI